MNLGIRCRVLVLALAPTTLISASLTAHFVATRIQDTERALIARGQAIVASLAPASEFGVASRNRAVLEQLASAVLRDADLAQVAILDREGAALIEKRADPARPADDARWFEAPIRRTLIEIDDLGEQRADQETRGESGPAVGAVRVALSRAGTIRRQREALFVGVAALLVCLGIVSLVGLYVGGKIYRPIRRLSIAFRDLGQGRYEIRLPERSPGELGALEQGFNRAANALKQTHDHLQEQVAAATAELQDALRQLENQNAELFVEREKAEAASRAKSRFVATVSHEIRTPLHGFVGFIDILARTPLDRTQQGYLRLLKHSASVLSAVIDGVLDFSKLEAGKIALRARPFDLRDTVETAARLFAANARAKGLELEIALDPDLPERVSGDRHRFAQIARNLVDNAIKFTERGRIRVRVDGGRRPDGAFLCRLSVRDTGIGIPRDHRRSIFGAFDQVDASTTRRQDGTGLGLAICRQLAELMKGRIKVRSREGVGSEFRVEIPFPVADPAAAADEPGDGADGADDGAPPRPSPIDEPPSVRPRIGATRVLVVDDNRINRVYSKIALSDFRAEVVLAESGHEALEACRRQRFDLILMDVRMPGMDGLETTRRIRRWRENPNCRTPIVGLTADALNVDRQSWRGAGMDDCLYKPLSEDRMRQVLAAWGAGRPSGTGAAPNPSR